MKLQEVQRVGPVRFDAVPRTPSPGVLFTAAVVPNGSDQSVQAVAVPVRRVLGRRESPMQRIDNRHPAVRNTARNAIQSNGALITGSRSLWIGRYAGRNEVLGQSNEPRQVFGAEPESKTSRRSLRGRINLSAAETAHRESLCP